MDIKDNSTPPGLKKAVDKEVFLFLTVFLGFFILMGREMGVANMFNTLMNTAYQLLLDTVFYIMAIAVLAGAISALFSEFGVISLLNKLLSRVIEFLYGLPGASAVGVFTTYLSDNPAILTLASDNNFRRFFRKYQLPALTNIGTSFGMGLIITTFMAGLKSPTGENFGLAVLVGNLGAVVGSIVSTRLMLRHTAKIYGKDAPCDVLDEEEAIDIHHYRKVRQGNASKRFMDALLEGGKNGVEMGMGIIPGVLLICTLVLMLTNSAPESGYTGAAYEGIGLLPWVGSKLSFILQPLFGFSNPEAIAVPITALGAAGAAIGIVEKLIADCLANAHDIAVFTAMCMCWSGYLSTHVAMMDNLKCGYLTGPAILFHTIGGLCAGVFANWAYTLLSMLF
jgi:spore maturation protein SpmB